MHYQPYELLTPKNYFFKNVVNCCRVLTVYQELRTFHGFTSFYLLNHDENHKDESATRPRGQEALQGHLVIRSGVSMTVTHGV